MAKPCPIQSWFEILEPYFVREFGPVPSFEYHETDALQKLGSPLAVGSRKGKLCIFWSEKSPFWDYCLKSSMVLYRDTSDDETLRRLGEGLGQLFLVLLHEGVHLYQWQAMDQKKSRISQWLDAKLGLDTLWETVPVFVYRNATLRNIFYHVSGHSKYLYCLEGVGTFGALKIANDLFESTTEVDINALKQAKSANGDWTETGTNILKAGLLKNIMKRAIAQHIDTLSKTLSLFGYSQVGDYESLFLPMPVSSFTKELAERSGVGMDRELARSLLPYARGLMLCGKLIRQGSITLQELVKNPMTEKEMQRMSGEK